MDFIKTIWNINTGIHSFLALVSLYFAITLIYHHIKLNKPSIDGFFRQSIEKRYSVLTKYTCISIAIASLSRHFISLIYQVTRINRFFSNASLPPSSNDDTNICVGPYYVGNTFQTVGSGLVYLFLWFRQRIFYVNPSLRISNSCLRVFSFAILILWILFWISLLIAYFIMIQFHFENKVGCVFESDSKIAYFKMVLAWTAVSFFMQIGLLVLFVFPIFNRSLWRNQQRNERNSRLMKRVKKAVILTSVCLGTDIVTFIVLVLLYEEYGNFVYSTYSINLVINHLVTIACFDYWKKLLWPWNVNCGAVCWLTSRREEISSSSSISSHQQQTEVNRTDLNRKDLPLYYTARHD